MLGTSLATIFQVTKWIWNTLFHQCVSVVAIYAIWIPIENYSNPFSWHVILCTLGFMPLMVESLILYSNENVWSQEIDRKQKHWVHGILMFIAAFLIITGIALEIDRRAAYPESGHFISAHSVTGLISMIFLVFTLICGPLVLFTDTIVSNYIPLAWLKLIHNALGQLTYIIGVVSLILGYHVDWFKYYTSESSRITATVVTVLILVWSLIPATKSIYNQIKNVLH